MLSVSEIRMNAGYCAAGAEGQEASRMRVGFQQLFHLAGGTTAHAWHVAPAAIGEKKMLGWKDVFIWLAHFRSAERMLLRMSYRTATPEQVWKEAHEMNEKGRRA